MKLQIATCIYILFYANDLWYQQILLVYDNFVVLHDYELKYS